MPLPPPGEDAAVIIYLHGFPVRTFDEGELFCQRLRRHGLSVSCPDFNEPDFSTLTVTGMLNLRSPVRLTPPMKRRSR